MKLTLKGQCPSGKNHMMINPKTGRHYPNKRFQAWRDIAVVEIKKQIKKNNYNTPITEPVSVMVDYVSGDKRRRDAPGIIDALWHVLEKAQVVLDDALLGGLGCYITFRHCGYDKASPQVTITI